MRHPIRKLAIVGASARAAAFSALRAGYEVVAADLFADADLKRACRVDRISPYPEGLEDWLANVACDGWMYTGALENHPKLVDRMAAICPLLGNGGAVLAEVRDPLRLQAAFRQAGLSFPDTVADSDGLPHDGSWLCKTYRHAGGTGVSRLQTAEQRERATSDRAYFQRYVEGLSAAAVFAVGEERSHLLGLTQQLVGAESDHRWRYRGSISLGALDVPLMDQLWTIGNVLAREFRLRGLVGVDIVIAGDRLWAIEINPRYSASVEVVERAQGLHATLTHVAACTNGSEMRDEAIYEASGGPAHAKAILYAVRDVAISTTFYDWAIESTCRNPMSPELADVPTAGEQITAGSPVLTVFATGDDIDQLLNRRLAEVEQRLYAA